VVDAARQMYVCSSCKQSMSQWSPIRPPATVWRPKDSAIIDLLSNTYTVPRETAVKWIVDLAKRLEATKKQEVMSA
jgi:hypothetical protein